MYDLKVAPGLSWVAPGVQDYFYPLTFSLKLSKLAGLYSSALVKTFGTIKQLKNDLIKNHRGRAYLTVL